MTDFMAKFSFHSWNNWNNTEKYPRMPFFWNNIIANKKNGNVIKITQVFPVEQFISMWQLKIEFRINSPIELRNKISIQHNILWYIFIRIQ